MKRKICIINTGQLDTKDVYPRYKAHDPEVEVFSIIDDSLIHDIMENGGPTPDVIKRMCSYAMMAETMGADLIVNQCSSAGEVADIYSKMVNIPVMKIDQAMAEKAVELGSEIALIATVPTTLGPSRRLIESVAKAQGKTVHVREKLADGAMLKLFAGDVKGHNDMLRGLIEEEDGKVDAIVLAQGSMLAIMPEVAHVKTPVLTSIPLGAERAVKLLHEYYKD